MPALLWTGKISLPLRLMVNMGSIIAWITGNARHSSVMKERMKDGYNGKYSDYIHKYDELGSVHYEKISNKLIQKIDFNGKEVVDVGCGTGILSFIALEKGASKISCVDISKIMLEKCREKSITKGYTDDLISFHEGDAEKLPFNDAAFDIVLLNMVLGIVPNQQATITELTRILRPGGTIALSAHGPMHYMEAIEASVKSMNMRYFFSHRFEFWPRGENDIKTFFMNAGLDNVQTGRLTWIDEFEDGGEVFDFFASTSALWWYHRLPPEIRNRETEKTRSYFQRKNINKITSDVVFAYGSKNRAI
jgi:ubiquinone/menaquinone biosynthesis C-methylase UbiE